MKATVQELFAEIGNLHMECLLLQKQQGTLQGQINDLRRQLAEVESKKPAVDPGKT